MRRLALPLLLALLPACADDPTSHDAPPLPDVVSASVGANEWNVLSAIVTARVGGADSVALRYRLVESGGEAFITPAVVPADSLVEAAILGLFPERSYEIRVVAFGPGGVTVGEPLRFESGSLPPDLPRYIAGGSDPSPGFVVFAAGLYGIVIDNSGRVVWYRRFPEPGPGLSFMAQPTGRYAARPASPDAADADPWVELDALGRVTATIGCAGGLRPRMHDLIARPDGSHWLLCDETRPMDLSSVGGSTAALVTATAAQHVAADGRLLFGWTPFDHFDIAEAAPAELTKASVNWTHGNALDLDPDGHLVISFRNLGEVTRIDTRTGEVLWRLGGRGNQFTVQGGSDPPFIGQHSVRVIASDTLVLLDNAGDPGQSRAERYAVEEGHRIARLTGSVGAGPGIATLLGGSVQPLAAGRTLVSFGTAGRVEEYDAAGRVVWRIEGNAGYVFRAQRIVSLYAPGVGSSR